MTSFEELLAKQLKNPEFKKEWEESEASYQAGRLVIQERLAKSLSQRQLAKRANTTQAVISRVEGFGVNPSVLLLSKIAKALGKKLEIRFV